jgi:hypothetical protein
MKGDMSFGDVCKAWVSCLKGTPFSQQAMSNLFPQSQGGSGNFVNASFVARNSKNPQTVALANRAADLAKAINANPSGSSAQLSELRSISSQLITAAKGEGLA